MDYDELVAKVVELLQREKRVPFSPQSITGSPRDLIRLICKMPEHCWMSERDGRGRAQTLNDARDVTIPSLGELGQEVL